jgi:hypothetical protein
MQTDSSKRFIFTLSIYFNGHPIWLLRTSATWDESNTPYELNEDFGYEMKDYFWLSLRYKMHYITE